MRTCSEQIRRPLTDMETTNEIESAVVVLKHHDELTIVNNEKQPNLQVSRRAVFFFSMDMSRDGCTTKSMTSWYGWALPYQGTEHRIQACGWQDVASLMCPRSWCSLHSAVELGTTSMKIRLVIWINVYNDAQTTRATVGSIIKV